MTYPFRLETERLFLRFMAPNEALSVLNFILANTEYFQKYSPKYIDAYLTEEYQQRRLQFDQANRENGRSFRFWIFEKSNPSEIVGNVNFDQIIRGGFQSCFVGYKIAESHCRQGIMTEALKASADYMFQDKELHRIEANIMPRNIASLKVVEKVGFENEGLAKKFLKINGTWEDHFRYALLNQE